MTEWTEDMPSEAELQAREERVRAAARKRDLEDDSKPCDVCGEPVLWGSRHRSCTATKGDDRDRPDELPDAVVDAIGNYWHAHSDVLIGDSHRAMLVGAELALPLLTAERERAWDEGYTSGHSNAMRYMSDEPNAPRTPNPYRSEGDRD